ncbi:MAG: hypothetical protein AAGH89_17610, partial [Verrucomicrobiota bacterium]
VGNAAGAETSVDRFLMSAVAVAWVRVHGEQARPSWLGSYALARCAKLLLPLGAGLFGGRVLGGEGVWCFALAKPWA